MKVEGPALFHPHQYILRDVMDAPTHVFSLEEEMQTETECHCQYPHAHKTYLSTVEFGTIILLCFCLCLIGL